jgi:hypothetical protein
MGVLGSVGKSIYKGATSRVGAGMIIGGAAAAGLYKTAARPAMDAAMDVALGDPNADQHFVGEKLSPLVFGAGAIGGMAGAAKLASPQYYQDFMPPVKPAVGVGLTGGIGALAGGLMGRGFLGKGKGALIGGAIGGALGLAGYGKLAANRAAQGENTPYAGNRRLNPNTLNYDDYENTQGYLRNSSLAMANKLNSHGDIVFGMHNMRRGY